MMIAKRLVPALLLALLAMGSSARAGPCTCAGPEPARSYRNAAAVVLGRVIGPLEGGYAVAVTQAWKRPVPAQITVMSSGICGVTLDTGGTYLLYLFGQGDGYGTSECSGNLAEAGAGVTLRWLAGHGHRTR